VASLGGFHAGHGIKLNPTRITAAFSCPANIQPGSINVREIPVSTSPPCATKTSFTTYELLNGISQVPAVRHALHHAAETLKKHLNEHATCMHTGALRGDESPESNESWDVSPSFEWCVDVCG
jgi:hypothetical protein